MTTDRFPRPVGTEHSIFRRKTARSHVLILGTSFFQNERRERGNVGTSDYSAGKCFQEAGTPWEHAGTNGNHLEDVAPPSKRDESANTYRPSLLLEAAAANNQVALYVPHVDH
jgi:hypothetical protein